MNRNKKEIQDDTKEYGLPKREIYIEHCLRLVEENIMTYEEVVCETKTMLAGVWISDAF